MAELARNQAPYVATASARNGWICGLTASLWLVFGLAAFSLTVSWFFLPLVAVPFAAAAWLSHAIATKRAWSVEVSDTLIAWDYRYTKRGPKRAVRLQDLRRVLVVRGHYGWLAPENVAITLCLKDGTQVVIPAWLGSYIDHVALLRVIEGAVPNVLVRYSS